MWIISKLIYIYKIKQTLKKSNKRFHETGEHSFGEKILEAQGFGDEMYIPSEISWKR